MTSYSGNSDYSHDTQPSTGILITNLGTPDEPTTKALRRYLGEFLSDPRVIEVPRFIWWCILHGIILRTRPGKSAKAYQKIWTDEGSPLLSISRKQATAIRENLKEQTAGPVHVVLAMRYGNPSIIDGLNRLRELNAQRLLVLPLYPQYSATTTASTFDAVSEVLKTWRWLPELRMVRHYHDHPGYIDALVESIRVHWASHEKPDKLLFSFHGLPKHYFLAGDPYYCECQKTARLVAEELELKEEQWAVSFQSRFGPREWLKPYTDKLLEQWGKSGVEHAQIICPGFSADCLETLEEIKLQNQGFFLAAGGKKFSYIPALNEQSAHINTLTDIIFKHCQGWPEFSADWDAQAISDELEKTEQRAARQKTRI